MERRKNWLIETANNQRFQLEIGNTNDKITHPSSPSSSNINKRRLKSPYPKNIDVRGQL